MKHPITLEALEVLDAIARKGSFAAAAEELNKVPSAVSYAVQKLEQDLGVTAFRKEGRKSVLTATGRLLLEQGRELLEASERLAIAAKTSHLGWEPVLNIGFDSLLDPGFLYPVIQRFYEAQPDIEINLFEEVLGGTLEAVVSGRADWVLGVSDPKTGLGIKYRPLGQIDWLFVAAPGHPIHEEPLPLTLASIGHYRFVVVRDSARHQAPQSRRLFSKAPVLSVATARDKIDALRQGLGVGFLPAHRIQAQLANRQLLALPITPAPAPEPIFLAWKNGRQGKALHWFLENLPSRAALNP